MENRGQWMGVCADKNGYFTVVDSDGHKSSVGDAVFQMARPGKYVQVSLETGEKVTDKRLRHFIERRNDGRWYIVQEIDGGIIAISVEDFTLPLDDVWSGYHLSVVNCRSTGMFLEAGSTPPTQAALSGYLGFKCLVVTVHGQARGNKPKAYPGFTFHAYNLHGAKLLPRAASDVKVHLQNHKCLPKDVSAQDPDFPKEKVMTEFRHNAHPGFEDANFEPFCDALMGGDNTPNMEVWTDGTLSSVDVQIPAFNSRGAFRIDKGRFGGMLETIDIVRVAEFLDVTDIVLLSCRTVSAIGAGHEFELVFERDPASSREEYNINATSFDDLLKQFGVKLELHMTLECNDVLEWSHASEHWVAPKWDRLVKAAEKGDGIRIKLADSAKVREVQYVVANIFAHEPQHAFAKVQEVTKAVTGGSQGGSQGGLVLVYEALKILTSKVPAADLAAVQTQITERFKVLADPDRNALVAIVGPSNAGKSTTVNALFGQRVVPSSGVPNTLLPVFIREKLQCDEAEVRLVGLGLDVVACDVLPDKGAGPHKLRLARAFEVIRNVDQHVRKELDNSTAEAFAKKYVSTTKAFAEKYVSTTEILDWQIVLPNIMSTWRIELCIRASESLPVKPFTVVDCPGGSEVHGLIGAAIRGMLDSVTDEAALSMFVCSNGTANMALLTDKPRLEKMFGSTTRACTLLVNRISNVSEKEEARDYISKTGKSELIGKSGEFYFCAQTLLACKLVENGTSQAPQDPSCQKCEEGDVQEDVEHYCVECAEYLCAQCAKYHHAKGIAKTHTLQAFCANTPSTVHDSDPHLDRIARFQLSAWKRDVNRCSDLKDVLGVFNVPLGSSDHIVDSVPGMLVERHKETDGVDFEQHFNTFLCEKWPCVLWADLIGCTVAVIEIKKAELKNKLHVRSLEQDEKQQELRTIKACTGKVGDAFRSGNVMKKLQASLPAWHEKRNAAMSMLTGEGSLDADTVRKATDADVCIVWGENATDVCSNNILFPHIFGARLQGRALPHPDYAQSFVGAVRAWAHRCCVAGLKRFEATKAAQAWLDEKIGQGCHQLDALGQVEVLGQRLDLPPGHQANLGTRITGGPRWTVLAPFTLILGGATGVAQEYRKSMGQDQYVLSDMAQNDLGHSHTALNAEFWRLIFQEVERRVLDHHLADLTQQVAKALSRRERDLAMVMGESSDSAETLQKDMEDINRILETLEALSRSQP